tara:strand:+ start:122 stop:361 length:240 start_codon:yes stop_codon:yes gene_type:complete
VESANHNQRIQVDRLGEDFERRQKTTIFSGRIGSVTHLDDGDHHYETQQHESNKGKYFKNTRGTVPGRSSAEKKVKIAG